MTANLFRFILLAGTVVLTSQATTFRITPISIGGGYVISGTIDTDGTTGFLTPANFTHWKVYVTQTTDSEFTPKNTSAANISQVSTDGKKMYVPTSPDGFTDGGTLTFSGPASRGGTPLSVSVADFTGVNTAGGAAGWGSDMVYNYVPLNEPNAAIYTAAKLHAGQPNTFDISKVILNTAPLTTLFGRIVTDGTVGPLSPANIVSWRIISREEDVNVYNETNSQIINAVQVYSDSSKLSVYSSGGDLQIGIPMVNPRGGRPIIVTLADFTDPAYPQGIASYYFGWQGLVASKSPLTRNADFTVAKVKP